MAVGEGLGGAVEGDGRVARVTEEVGVEVTGTRCWTNNTARLLRASASLQGYISNKSQQESKYFDD
jgi:hypothetical protein